MKIIYNNILPIKGFIAMNLFGVLFVRKKYNPLSIYDINHELIHTQQMKELWYVLFYILYILDWIIKLLKYKNFNLAYRNIFFEKEAYTNMYDLKYLNYRHKFAFKNYLK